ncbi:MCE family protein [Nocardia gipuzkoensis]|uniref:MCE family protein n=1 Tax=Nocardia gipuzkoensis TaxID=2749991 RepID=UPI00245841E6|nr:MCE family protein [Nocardia gipuzkoensis]
MAESKQTESGLVRALRGGLGLKLAGAAMVLALVAIVAVALIMFVGGFTPTATVTVDAPRSGLVLDPDAKVKVRGVEIGRVASVDHTDEGARLKLALDPDLLRLVPSNADVDIRSTTVFGAKYVNFVVPRQPSSTPLQPGATLTAQRVTVEFNTLFQHLSDVLAKIEPEKLNATLSALGTALQGRGQKLGELLEQSDAYLRDINPYLPTLQQDLAKTGEVTDLYADTVNDLLRTVDNFTVTSKTLDQEQDSLDNVLVNLTGLADTTGAVLRENENDLGTALDLLRPTTGLLEDYAPALCDCDPPSLTPPAPAGGAALGALCEPALPDIKGIGEFEGEIFHSARWNHDADLTGKRVAIIGTGASAIQIVPAIAAQVGHLDVYQRTAPWLLPRLDRPYTKAERLAFKYVPGLQRLSRAAIYAARETQVVGLAKAPAMMQLFEAIAKAKLRYEIRDPRLRAKVTPNFRIGCKRMLISNDYYPALSRPNVDVVTDGIAEVRANSIVTEDGTEREIDALIVATGFHVTDSPTYDTIAGRDGRTLSEVFDEIGQQGYKGASIANFPNMFFLLGPNVGLGHTSMVYMIESQINYIADALATIDRLDLRTVEVRRDVQDAYNKQLQAKLAGSVWLTGGCSSWYLDKHGNNTTLWPDFTFEFRRLTKTFDVAAYDISISRIDVKAVAS